MRFYNYSMVNLRLKELRESVNKTQSEIAEQLKIQQNTYSQYETGRRQIPLEFLIELAKFYNVSVDYILNLTKIDFPYPKN